MNQEDRKHLTGKALLKAIGKTEEDVFVREGKAIAHQLKDEAKRAKLIKLPRALKRADRISITIHRLRQSTGATWPMVKDYLKRWHYWPLSERSNYVRFVNNSFVANWLKQEPKEQKTLNEKDQARKCHNCKTTLEPSAGNTFYCPTCKSYYFIEPEQTDLQKSLDSRDAVILPYILHQKNPRTKGATMKIITRILGKERELARAEPGTVGEGLFFLNKPTDMSETGIYTGETLDHWEDEAYLHRIRAHPQMIFFIDKQEAPTWDERRNSLVLPDKPTTEYRFENTDFGQGHYFTDLTDCLEAAREYGKGHWHAKITIEAFRPKRYPIATLQYNTLRFAPHQSFTALKLREDARRQEADKPFTVQTAEKTSEDIRRLRKTNYGRQPLLMITTNLRKLAESESINQSTSQKASLWNAIEILEDKEQEPMKRRDYDLLSKVIKRLPGFVTGTKSKSEPVGSTVKRLILINLVPELRKNNANFDQDKFTKDCGL